MDDPYLWFKSLHIISVIAWMAGLFYLPRLFVYHADTDVGSEQSETFKIMERRLLKAITTPAMISSWIFGLLAAWQINAFADGWFHAKLLLVLMMSGYHGYLVRYQKAFANDQNTKSARFFRIVNEVPTLLMAVIVILVIFKPF